MRDIHDIVLRIVCKQLDLMPDEISLDDELIDDLAADSLDIVEIEMSLEDEFKIDNGYDCENWFNNKVTLHSHALVNGKYVTLCTLCAEKKSEGVK